MIPLALYLVMPVIMVAVSTVIGKTVKKICPQIFYLLNGGR